MNLKASDSMITSNYECLSEEEEEEDIKWICELLSL
jgi:hypothetical protein